MKIIDILNKIANGEEVPKKILYNDYIFEYEDGGYFSGEAGYLFERYYPDKILNDEVEIIEEPKKINKIRIDYNSINIDKAFGTGTTTFFRKDIEIFQCLSSKINEIIEVLNEVNK